MIVEFDGVRAAGEEEEVGVPAALKPGEEWREMGVPVKVYDGSDGEEEPRASRVVVVVVVVLE